MKKVSLFLGYLIISFIGINSVSAQWLISQWYETKKGCEDARSENNKLFPGYERGACIQKNDRKYYYNICTSASCFGGSQTDDEKQTDQHLSENVKAFLKGIEQKTAWMSLKQKAAYKIKVDKAINNLLEKYKNNPSKIKFINELKIHSDEAFVSAEIDSTPSTANDTVEEKETIKDEDSKIVQGLYQATNWYYSLNDYKYKNVCKTDLWWEWTRDTWKWIDAHIMLSARQDATMWNKSPEKNKKCYTYGPGYKTEEVSCESKQKVACIIDPVNKVVNNKYRLTKNHYKGVEIIKEDLCKTEFGNEWKLIKEDRAWVKALVNAYPKADFWLTIPWYYKNLPNNTHFYYDKNGWGWSEYKMNGYEWNRFAQYGKISRYVPAAKDSYKLRFACKKDELKEQDPTKMVQWLYKWTSKKYSYKEASNISVDLCKKEYGYLWKTQTKSIDANIMLKSKNKLDSWIIWGKQSCSYYDGKKTVTNCQKKLSLACTRDNSGNKNENYKKYLKESTTGMDSFYKEVEREAKSKIVEKWDFIYFNNKFALSKKQYYGNQIYTERKCKDWWTKCLNGEAAIDVCPNNFKISQDEGFENEAELIWYYYSQNYQKYNKVWNKSKTWFNVHMWRWNKFDHRYATSAKIEDIKKNAMQNYFKTSVLRMANPYLGWHPNKTDFTHEEKTTFMSFSGHGSSSAIWIKQPVLCVTTDKKLLNNTISRYWTNKEPISKKIKVVEENVIINDKQDIYGHTFFYGYHKAKSLDFFEKSIVSGINDQIIFEPILFKGNGSYYYLFYKKLLKEKK